MQALEPYYNWRHLYTAEEDPQSPFYENVYNEFEFQHAVYNYVIHPQWDDFGSRTLYLKILYADYEASYAIIEFIGEWNDVLENDIMLLKRNVLEPLMEEGIFQFIFITESVMNLHVMDTDYYDELMEDLEEEAGWVVCVNTPLHVSTEWKEGGLGACFFFYDVDRWRTWTPEHFYEQVAQRLNYFLE